MKIEVKMKVKIDVRMKVKIKVKMNVKLEMTQCAGKINDYAKRFLRKRSLGQKDQN